jgi:hypothetical protein
MGQTGQSQRKRIDAHLSGTRQGNPVVKGNGMWDGRSSPITRPGTRKWMDGARDLGFAECMAAELNDRRGSWWSLDEAEESIDFV